MQKFVLDDTIATSGNQIQSLSQNIYNVSSTVSGYNVSDASDFDFAGAISVISSNLEVVGKKMENTALLITTVIDTHASIQSSLIYDANTSYIEKLNSLKSQSQPTSNYNRATYYGYSSGYSSGGTSEVTLAVSDEMTSNEQALTVSQEFAVVGSLGAIKTFTSWDLSSSNNDIENNFGNQNEFAKNNEITYNEEGFAIVNGRYVIICSSNYGTIGDYIDFIQSDGTTIKCIIGQTVETEEDNLLSDQNNLFEFVVNNEIWDNNHENIGSEKCHPEWNQNIIKVINYHNQQNNEEDK